MENFSSRKSTEKQGFSHFPENFPVFGVLTLPPSVIRSPRIFSKFLRLFLKNSTLVKKSHPDLEKTGIPLWLADAKTTRSYFLSSTSIRTVLQLSDLWWQYWSKVKKAGLCFLGGIFMFKTKFYNYKPKVCPEIGKILFLDKPPAYSSRTYFWAYFSTLFEHILCPYQAYLGIPINAGPRN